MIRTFGKTKVFVSVISARRPSALKPMTDLIGRATWLVDDESLEAYMGELVRNDLDAGVAIGGKLCRARNLALDMAFASQTGVLCLQLSDDLKKIEQPEWDETRKKYVAKPMDFDTAVLTMIVALQSTGAKLAGVAPTSNPFYYRGKPIHPRAFIVGDMILVGNTTLRFDEEMRLKEDYDYTLKHLDSYGRVARCDDVLATFQHRSNAGGAVAYRTPEEEQRAIEQLKKRWGRLIADNPKRPNEILLKLPR